MFTFEKQGLVFSPMSIKRDWFAHSALTPTPIRMNDGNIRVLCGLRDDSGVSRIGCVDLVWLAGKFQVCEVSRTPSLDVGREGCFDDGGVILGDTVHHDGKLYLFYVGFQKPTKAKFLAFSGLAVSVNNGLSFEREYEHPILDRSAHGNFIGAIHTARFENNIWRIWFARGDSWERIGGGEYPRYEICYAEFDKRFSRICSPVLCIQPVGKEYRVGRPKVYRRANGGYDMFFTAGTRDGEYFPRYAHSPDGITWTRAPSPVPFQLSSSGWDSIHLSYPSFINWQGGSCVFYNGNDMGRNGFGLAFSNYVVS